jgi:hypothetical protein
MEESRIDNAGNHQTDKTWQCWMVNTKTGEEKLVTQGHQSQEECQRESVGVFVQWDKGLYPSSEGWTVVYRQDSPLQIAQYWRDHYQESAKFWKERYDEASQECNQYRQQLSHVEQAQPSTNAQSENPVHRRWRPTLATTAFWGRCKQVMEGCIWGGQVLVGTLFLAIAPEVLVLIKELPKGPLLVAQRTTDIPLSIRQLFGSKKAPGAIAIGVAEGNLTPTGKPTSIYLGHTDPGNFATNRGFCSWNKSESISVAEADRRCLKALQRQSVATENQLLALGLNPESHKSAIVIGTDLWNQSDSAGPVFSFKYKTALDQGFKAKKAYLWARVEAFRDEKQQLDASGLFGICRREAFYRQQLKGLLDGSEKWRWNCIALDQKRRILEIEKVF